MEASTARIIAGLLWLHQGAWAKVADRQPWQRQIGALVGVKAAGVALAGRLLPDRRRAVTSLTVGVTLALRTSRPTGHRAAARPPRREADRGQVRV